MITSDELYEKLTAVCDAEGLLLNLDGIDALRTAARVIHTKNDDATPGRFNTGDPNDRWQCYTPEANKAMQGMFESLVIQLRAGHIRPLSLSANIRAGFEAIENIHGITPFQGGYHDTEPEWELVDALNLVLDELGYKQLEERDW